MQVAFTSHEEEEEQQDEGELESDESEHISFRQSTVGKGVAPSEHH